VRVLDKKYKTDDVDIKIFMALFITCEDIMLRIIIIENGRIHKPI